MEKNEPWGHSRTDKRLVVLFLSKMLDQPQFAFDFVPMGRHIVQNKQNSELTDVTTLQLFISEPNLDAFINKKKKL